MTGHVRRRGARSWEIKFDLGRDPLTGKRLTRYASFKGTKRDAELEAARLISGAATGSTVDPSKTTLSDFLDRWERDWVAGNVSPKTAERYGEILRKHIRAHIGAIAIQKLKPTHLAELYSKLLREGKGPGVGLSARTVGHVHRVFHRALGHAQRWGLVQQNVADLVSPPRVASTEVQILKGDEVQALLKSLQGQPLYSVAAVALATGMRRGELLALRWSDVDLKSAKIRVERSLETTKAGLRFKEPKTRHGRRSITLPTAIVTELRLHWKRQQERRLALGQGKASDSDLVFSNFEGQPIHPDGLTKEWARALRPLGLRFTLHSLRHTHASQLIASGLDILTISRRLGHGSPAITLGVYGHLFSNTDDRAAQVMEATFAGLGTE